MKIKAMVRSLLRRRRPVTREEAVEIADWVNEGGSFDPAGPPPVIEDDRGEEGRLAPQ